MSSAYVPQTVRRLVAERADYRCEYCLVPESEVLLSHQPDHIIASQHGGKSVAVNLAFACVHCNRHKGSNIASIDPTSGQLTPLFNPRTQVWTDHFALDGAYIRPLSSIGRVTERLLHFNVPDRVRVRQALIAVDKYP